jgi:hypothetical protein
MKHDPRLDAFDEKAWADAFDESDWEPLKPTRWQRFKCWLGYHRPMAASSWWPHETECLHCGCKLLMDTRGQFFRAYDD